MKTKLLVLISFLFLNYFLKSQVSYFQVKSFTDSVSTPGLKKYGLKMHFHNPPEQMIFTVIDYLSNTTYFGDSIPNIFTNITGSYPLACIAQPISNMNDTIASSIIDPSKSSMITINQLTSPNGTNCDGEIHVYVDTIGRNFAAQGFITQSAFNDYSANQALTAPMEQNDWTNLCSGKYAFIVWSYNNTTSQYKNEEWIDFFIGANAFSTSNVNITINPYALASGTVCSGKVKVSTNLSNPPTYSFDNGIYTSIDSLTGLCAGYHTLNVATPQDTIGRFFIISDSLNVTNNPNNYGTVIDTIIYNYVNCNFNYALPVDSAFLINAQTIDSNTIFLSWKIWQAGISIIVSDTLSVTYQQGNNMISLIIFCGNSKSTVNVGNNSKRINDYAMLSKPSTTSIKQTTLSQYTIYPNPVTDILFIKNAIGSNLELFDILGHRIMNTSVTTESRSINLSGFNSGIYYLKITKNDFSEIKKIVKQ